MAFSSEEQGMKKRNKRYSWHENDCSRETHAAIERENLIVKLEISVGGEESESLMYNYSDSESPSNSPSNHSSSVSASNISVTNFSSSGSRSSYGSSRSSYGSSRSSRDCYSGSMKDEDDADDGCLDDWEVMADALAAEDIQKNLESPVRVHPHSYRSQSLCCHRRVRIS